MKVIAYCDAWTVFQRSSIPPNSNEIGSRLDLTLKNVGTDREKYKFRFFCQGFKDYMKPFVVHDFPTLLQISTNLILSSVAILDYLITILNFTQAYL